TWRSGVQDRDKMLQLSRVAALAVRRALLDQDSVARRHRERGAPLRHDDARRIEPGLGAVHPQGHAAAFAPDERSTHPRGDVAGQRQDSIRLEVDTWIVRVELSLGRQHARLPPGGPEQIRGVAADVHDGSAGEIPVQSNVAGLNDEARNAEVDFY